jgi:uncharacterized protein
MTQNTAERIEATATSPAIANPTPLGVSAFALTTFVLDASNAQLFTGDKIVIGLALFYGGIAHMLAGMWEFRSGNTFAATAFTSYGAFWLAIGFSLQNALIPNATTFAYFLLGWTIFTFIMLLGSLKTNVAFHHIGEHSFQLLLAYTFSWKDTSYNLPKT